MGDAVMSLMIILGALVAVVLFLLGVREVLGVRAARRRAVTNAESQLQVETGSLFNEYDVWLRKTRIGRWLQNQLELAGVERPVALVFSAGAATAILATVLLWSFVAPLLAVLGIAVGYLAIRWYLGREQSRRREAFITQLPELARVLSNASYAGLSLPTAIAIAAEEMPEPAHTELGRVATQLKFGRPLATALAELQTRVGSRETNVLISTLVVSARSGGSLVTALRGIADSLEQRRETRREINTTLAQAKATASLVIVIGIGMLLMLNLIKSGTVDMMTRRPAGQIALVLAAVLFGGGYFVIRRMTKIDE